LSVSGYFKNIRTDFISSAVNIQLEINPDHSKHPFIKGIIVIADRVFSAISKSYNAERIQIFQQKKIQKLAIEFQENTPVITTEAGKEPSHTAPLKHEYEPVDYNALDLSGQSVRNQRKEHRLAALNLRTDRDLESVEVGFTQETQHIAKITELPAENPEANQEENYFNLSSAGTEPLSSKYFESLANKEYIEEEADAIDDLIFDILLAAEKGDLEMLQNRTSKLNEADPQNRAITLKAVKDIVMTLKKQDKIKWITQEIIKNKEELKHSTEFNKNLEIGKPYVNQLEKEKKEMFSKDWAENHKTIIKCFYIGMFLIFPVTALSPYLNENFTSLKSPVEPEPEPVVPIGSTGTDSSIYSVKIVTGYASGNPARDKMSNLVVDSQKQYADLHGYDYEAYTENRAKECRYGEECQPQWSKIAIIRDWLQEPKKSCKGENWIVWLDDDMPITNPQYDLKEMISTLQKNSETSVIVTQDPQNWHGARETSINTGALFVRHDNTGRDVVDQIWNARNNPAGIATLGTCPNQICLHEQAALAYLLRKNYKWVYTGKVSVVEPRTSTVAVNTLARGDEYHDIGRNMHLHFHNDLQSARWQPGDFAGQCSGLPTNGYEPGKKPRNIRLECVEELIQSSKAHQ
jgi:hypothetical protein